VSRGIIKSSMLDKRAYTLREAHMLVCQRCTETK
jgi:hypothetical protein